MSFYWYFHESVAISDSLSSKRVVEFGGFFGKYKDGATRGACACAARATSTNLQFSIFNSGLSGLDIKNPIDGEAQDNCPQNKS